MITARARTGNPAGTLPTVTIDADSGADEKIQHLRAVGEKAGDRDRTGDVQLGKQRKGVAGKARKSKKKS
jgi:hypothetical protein